MVISSIDNTREQVTQNYQTNKIRVTKQVGVVKAIDYTNNISSKFT